jgi:hypothetical protein
MKCSTPGGLSLTQMFACSTMAGGQRKPVRRVSAQGAGSEGDSHVCVPGHAEPRCARLAVQR